MSVAVTKLTNGLTVASDPMPHVDTATVGIWVGTGTRDEPADQGGIAHLLEHMAFKGTSTRSARAIAEAIEPVGGHLNAYTSREQTAYYAKVLAEDTPLAIDILADILRDSQFDADELARERAVVLQEIGQASDTPDDIIFDHFQEVAFPDQPLGRPVLGRPDSVERIERTALIEFVAARYQPSQMVVVGAGQLKHDDFVRRIEARFGDMPDRGAPTAPQARYHGGQFHEDRDLEQVHLVLGFPGITATDPDHYAHSVYSTLLGGGMSSRLFQEVRETRGLVYSIYSFASAFLDTGLFGIYAGTGPDQVDELIPVICTELRRAAEDVTAEELDRAKAQLRAGTLMARESSSSRAETLANQLLVHDRAIATAELLEKLAAVTLDDVRRMATGVLAGVPTVAAMGPLEGTRPYDMIHSQLM